TVDGAVKLQLLIIRNAGYRLAWSDAYCIDKNNNIELQQSVDSKFIWYRHSAPTVMCLSDILSSSKFSALAMSVWNSRGWTVRKSWVPNRT
ncbi:hypothetical protein M405DRAFT_693332, partial [Rhizopogon salebrosus TDB-379]